MGLWNGTDFVWIDNYQTKQHSDFINQGLERLLVASHQPVSAIKKIIVDHGPGSFTGVRVAIGFVRALAYGLGITIEVCHSLDALGESGSTKKAIKALNAFRQSAYYQNEQGGIELLSIQNIHELVLKNSPIEVELIGDLYLAYQSFWSPAFNQKIKITPEVYQPQLQPQQYQANQVRPLHHPHVLNLYQLWVDNKLKVQTKSWVDCVPYYVRLSSAEEVWAEKQKSQS